ncbi:DUF3179 domain-containing protein [Dichotomicrobium thermohalophilum]|uniref:Uncharacterized protein DUF3179 n=1 Tax=Dichotomicrobium thermohalophilum TaxID=933063 RepID=A0A397Q3H5_9HYPH|nr:DUF3179 domain-containing protein [Dichotomicrobium thermohalophilum]RIA55588.1 uncharacterized protein DUF3179 [Dichotomicrobium thermohalophilum]
MRAVTAFLIAVVTATTATANPSAWKRQGWADTNFSKRAIEWNEIMSGGPPKDGIPSIDEPKFQPVADETEVAANEPVIGLEINGDARAYPLRILIWHEIVNDTVGGEPVAVTYCPLCNSAVVFKRAVKGETTTFGTTGKLRNSDLVMYDRLTESWWQQFTGKAIVGEMTGTQLEILPARLEALAQFRERHPDGKILVPNNPNFRNYGRNPYAGYDSSARPFLFRGDLPEDINPMVRVVMVRTDQPTILSLNLLRTHERIQAGDVTLTWAPGQASALDDNSVAGGRDVGTVAVERETADGAEDVPYDVTFAFVAHAFHPETAIVQQCPDDDDTLKCVGTASR